VVDHYCKGDLKGTSLIIASSCASEKGKSCCKKATHKKCCDNQVELSESDQDIASPSCLDYTDLYRSFTPLYFEVLEAQHVTINNRQIAAPIRGPDIFFSERDDRPKIQVFLL